MREKISDMSRLPLTNTTMSVKLVVCSGWGLCPICGNPKFIKIDEDTEARNLPHLCKRCRQVSRVDIEPEPAAIEPSA